MGVVHVPVQPRHDATVPGSTRLPPRLSAPWYIRYITQKNITYHAHEEQPQEGPMKDTSRRLREEMYEMYQQPKEIAA